MYHIEKRERTFCMIRCTSKAIIIKEDKILLNLCRLKPGDPIFYDLPGGGQEQYESMEDALRREVLEECGYHINIIGLAAVGEQIASNPFIRENYPNHAHRLFHIFLAEVTGEEEMHSNEDLWQEKSVWVPLDELDSICVRPEVFTERIKEIIYSQCTVYCGCKML